MEALKIEYLPVIVEGQGRLLALQKLEHTDVIIARWERLTGQKAVLLQ